MDRRLAMPFVAVTPASMFHGLALSPGEEKKAFCPQHSGYHMKVYLRQPDGAWPGADMSAQF